MHATTKKIIIVPSYFISYAPDGPPLTKQSGEPIKPAYNDWHPVYWGVPHQKLGRLTMALYLFDKMQADSIVFSVGNAVLADGNASESEWTQQYVYQAFDRLSEDFPEWFSQVDTTKLHEKVLKTAKWEKDSINTKTGLINSIRMIVSDLDEQEPAIVTVVTSANHASRALRDGAAAVHHDKLTGRIFLGTFVADTCYGGSPVSDTVVYDLGSVPGISNASSK